MGARVRKRRLVIFLLILFLFFCCFFSLFVGPAGGLSIKKTAGIVCRKLPFLGSFFRDLEVEAVEETIVLNVRLPRIFLAIVVGASLAAAGAVMQSFFQNPMASPYIIGISSGASLGATIVIAFGIDLFFGWNSTPVFAFFGALAITFVVYTLSRRGGKVHSLTLLLTGIAVGTLAMGMAYFIMFFTTDNYDQIIFWIMGTFNGKDWAEIRMILPYVVASVVLIQIFSRDLNILLLGEETAQHLGIDVEKIKIFLLVAASLLASVSVAAVGIVGFVGLIVPHLMRLIVGPDHRILIPSSLLGGAILVLVADTFSRTVLNEKIPIGVLTSILGCPFFLYLLSRREKHFF